MATSVCTALGSIAFSIIEPSSILESWLIFMTCLVAGSIVGFISAKVEKLRYAACGFALGLVLNLLFFMFFNGILPEIYQSHLFSVSAITGLTLAVLMGTFVKPSNYKKLLVPTLSLIGAYMITRSISVYMLDYPSEIAVYSGIRETSILTTIKFFLIYIIVALASHIL